MQRLSATSISSDMLRQGANVVAALGQVITTVIVFVTGTDGRIDTNTPQQTTPIVPASYTFAIWALIYGGALAYAAYQALPMQRSNPVLRAVGWYTALAYLGTSLWLVSASHGWIWLTVAIFFGILVALLGAFRGLLGHGAFSTAERLWVMVPISVYTGWASVAVVANVSTALQDSGIHHLLLPDQAWALIVLLVAGGIATALTIGSRGNAAYALTVVWALVGIVVANLTREVAPVIAGGAAIVAFALIGVLIAIRSQHGGFAV